MYRNYLECCRGLYRQGVLGFYKGNGMRIMQLLFIGNTQTRIKQRLDKDMSVFSRTSWMVDYISLCVSYILIHPFHLYEARLVLQNRIPVFSTYKSAFSLVTQNRTELFKGITMHIPRALLFSLCKQFVESRV